MGSSVQQIMLSSVVPAASGNWWTAGGATGCIQALQPKGAASYAASLNDLSGNGNNATEGTAPSWNASTGWTFNGSSEYLKTGITPDGSYTMIIQIANATASGDRIIGCFGGGRYFGFEMLYGGGNTTYYMNGNYAGVTPAATAGNFAITDRGYRDGVDDGVSLSGLGAALEVYIGCANVSGTPQYHWAGDIIASGLYSGHLSGTTIAALYAAMSVL